MNLRLQQTVTHFYSSDFRVLSEAQYRLCRVADFCLYSVESVENVWEL